MSNDEYTALSARELKTTFLRFVSLMYSDRYTLEIIGVVCRMMVKKGRECVGFELDARDREKKLILRAGESTAW